MKSLTLTIVIPAFNEQDHLMACLKAIAAQTKMPDQVIVVDNNSSDKTVEIAKSFPFVTLVHEKNQGVLYAKNHGFNLASSYLIGRIDADTILPKDWVEKVINSYIDAGSPDYFAATGPSVFRNRLKLLCYGLHRVTYFWVGYLMLGHHTLVGSNTVVTKKLWQDVSPNVCLRTDLHEDMDLAYHIGQTGTKIAFLNEIKASILARKMHRRLISYPLMMHRVRTSKNHLALDFK